MMDDAADADLEEETEEEVDKARAAFLSSSGVLQESRAAMHHVSAPVSMSRHSPAHGLLLLHAHSRHSTTRSVIDTVTVAPLMLPCCCLQWRLAPHDYECQ